MSTATIVILTLIVALYILEPEFFASIPEWVGLWWSSLRLWVVKTTFRWQLRRQIEKDKKDYEKFIKDHRG